MPPLVYDTRPNPFVGSIGELMQRRGDIEAQRATAVANAAAAATMASGQAWGGAVRDIGANVGGQLMKVGERMADPAHQAQELELAKLRRDRETQLTIEAGLQNQANWKEDGSGVDDGKMSAWLQTNGKGNAAMAWNAIATANAENRLKMAKTVSEIAASNATTAEKQQTLVAKQRSYVSELAFHTEQAIGPKGDSDPLHARDTFMAAVAHAAVDGGLSKEQARSVLQRTAGASPAQLREVLGSLVDPNDRAKFEKQAADTAKTQADTAKTTAEAANLAKYGAVTPPASQQVKVRMKLPGGATSDVPVEFLPGRTPEQPGAYYFNQDDGTRRQVFPVKDFTEIPAASVTIHNDKDAKAASTRGELVDSLIRGDLPPSMLSRRADDYNATLADASAKYRELTGKPLSIAKLQLDYEAAKKFTASMNSGQMVRYRGLSESVVNTIGEVERLGDALQQGGIQKWNSVKRSTIRSVYGNTPESELANQYVGAVNTLKEEFANLANGGYAPTDAAWHLANDQINGDFGFKDLRASLTEVQRLINYRTQAFNEQHPYDASEGHGQTRTPAAPIKVGGFSVIVK